MTLSLALLVAPGSGRVASAADLRPGEISISPSTYAVGATVKIAVDFPTASPYGNYPLLTLWSNVNGQWAPVVGQEDKKSSSAGEYTFSYSVAKAQKVRVESSPANGTNYIGGQIVKTPEVQLSPQEPGVVQLREATISVTPSSYAVGESVQIAVDFPTSSPYSQYPRVTLWSDASGTWAAATDPAGVTSTSDGKYSFSYVVTKQQKVRAESAPNQPNYIGGQTVKSPEVTLTPLQPGELPPGPTTPVSSVENPLPGQKVTVTGNIGTPVVRTVVLQQYSSGWSTYATAMTLADGSYSFTASTTSSSRRFRAYAKAENGLPSVTSPELVLKTQADVVSLVVSRRDGSATNRVAQGIASPAIEGRLYALQYLSGSTWLQIGPKVAATANGTVRIPFTQSGSLSYRLIGDSVDGSAQAKSRTVALTSTPSSLGTRVVYVNTDSGSTPTTKGVDYTATAVLDDASLVDDDVLLDVETIAVRGNSSADKPKKPYKLKFEEKQKPFGMKSDKTWILLANYQDRTLIRSRIAFELGRRQDGLEWTPNEVFAELYLNGKYLGSYQLIQSIKVDKNRVPFDSLNTSCSIPAGLSDCKFAAQVMEHDPHWVDDETYGFVGPSGMNYEYKDPDEYKTNDDGSPDLESLTDQRLAMMKQKILNFEKVLYSRDWSKINSAPVAAQDDWMTYLDLDSAVDYILTREFTKDNDADFYRSNFFYTKNYDPASPAKFFVGPIWDFDRSAGAHDPSSTGIHLPTGWWTNGSGSDNHDTNEIHWFTRIWKDPRFVDAVKIRWAAKRAEYKDVALTRVDAAVASVGANVAANDRAVWGSSGSRYAAKASTYAGEVSWVKQWYKDRYNWMDAQLSSSPDPI